MTKLQEAQQWKRSPVHVLQQKTQGHCGEDIPDEVCLLELGWFTEEMIVMSQTSFGHISIKSPSILTVSMATESP